ncbi:serine hydrolase domain-containing protein [Pontibacter litorisediminis]|uniref:serine hydrolase domain-containing protein n=1 Tax=Pontibacter litorisediminis TaxID=1846260 RepID=UPI0023EE138B|nr:serine hydrolase domain-containing protein [Pontibacter litorisediminis]
MRHILLTSVFSLVTLTLLGQGLKASLTQNLDELSERNVLPGFAVSVISPDSVLYTQAFGFSDISSQKPFTEKTILNIGSVSKTFVGLALMKAVSEGKLSLDSDINDFLPFKVQNPFYPDQPIKVIHLVTHTSGITDREEVYKQTYTKELDVDAYKAFLQEYLSRTGANYSEKNFLRYKPGEWQEYSNIGSALVALVVEGATKVPFSEYTRRHITAPLGLSSTGWFFRDIPMNNHAVLYSAAQKPIPLYSLLTYPDGGLKSNLHDLNKYLQEIMKGRAGRGEVLGDSSYNMLLAPQFGNNLNPRNINPKEPNIGVFWVHKRNGEIGHTGGDPGITTFVFFNPETATGRVFITNTLLEEEEQIEVFASIWRLLKAYEEKLLLPTKAKAH